MARVLSSSPLFSSLLSETTTIITKRRGYSVAAEAVRRNLASEEKVVVSSFIGSKRVKWSGSDSNSWIPDLVTGHYRPANRMVEADAAELREILLGPRV